MAERIFVPVIRFILTAIFAAPIWLLLGGLVFPRLGGGPWSGPLALFGIILVWEAARWLRARALRRYDL